MTKSDRRPWDQDEFREFLRSREAYHVEFLRELIAEDTSVVGHGWEGGYELSGQRLVQKKLEKMGCEVDVFEPDDQRLRLYADSEGNLGHDYRDRPNVVGKLPGSDSRFRSIILNGHTIQCPGGRTHGIKILLVDTSETDVYMVRLLRHERRTICRTCGLANRAWMFIARR